MGKKDVDSTKKGLKAQKDVDSTKKGLKAQKDVDSTKKGLKAQKDVNSAEKGLKTQKDVDSAENGLKAQKDVMPKAYAVFRIDSQVIEKRPVLSVISPRNMKWPKGAVQCSIELEVNAPRQYVTKQLGLTYVVGLVMDHNNCEWLHIPFKPEGKDLQYVLCGDAKVRVFDQKTTNVLSPDSVTFE